MTLNYCYRPSDTDLLINIVPKGPSDKDLPMLRTNWHRLTNDVYLKNQGTTKLEIRHSVSLKTHLITKAALHKIKNWYIRVHMQQNKATHHATAIAKRLKNCLMCELQVTPQNVFGCGAAITNVCGKNRTSPILCGAVAANHRTDNSQHELTKWRTTQFSDSEMARRPIIKPRNHPRCISMYIPIRMIAIAVRRIGVRSVSL